MYRDALDARVNYKIGKGIAGASCPVLDHMTERAKVLIGEINAGNTSLELRNELSRILLTLYKNKIISKAEYRRFMKL